MAQKSYRDLSIYQSSLSLFLRVHSFSQRLPKYEMYESGSQLRRAADSVNSNIVEGYGLRSNKQDFLRFLHIALSSNDETINHLLKIGKLYAHLEAEASILNDEYVRASRYMPSSPT